MPLNFIQWTIKSYMYNLFVEHFSRSWKYFMPVFLVLNLPCFYWCQPCLGRACFFLFTPRHTALTLWPDSGHVLKADTLICSAVHPQCCYEGNIYDSNISADKLADLPPSLQICAPCTESKDKITVWGQINRRSAEGEVWRHAEKRRESLEECISFLESVLL